MALPNDVVHSAAIVAQLGASSTKLAGLLPVAGHVARFETQSAEQGKWEISDQLCSLVGSGAAQSAN
jgi:hypothetical protein